MYPTAIENLKGAINELMGEGEEEHEGPKIGLAKALRRIVTQYEQVIFPEHLVIKNETLVFYATNGSHTIIWFEISDGIIAYFDYLPNNYPSFMVGKFKSEKEAEQRANQMVTNEGWTIIKSRWESEKIKEIS